MTFFYLESLVNVFKTKAANVWDINQSDQTPVADPRDQGLNI